MEILGFGCWGKEMTSQILLRFSEVSGPALLLMSCKLENSKLNHDCMLWCIQFLLLGVGRPALSNLTQGLWDMEGCVHQNEIILLEPWNWKDLSSITKINLTDFSCTLYLLVIGYRECKTGKTKVNLNKLKVTGFNLLLISSVVCTFKVKVVNNEKKNSIIRLCIVYQYKSSVSHSEVVAETGLV